MSGLRDLAKGGWHPKGKDGGRESFRSDMKGVNQLAGWMGKGKSKQSALEQAKEHHSAPLSTLKDPNSFGPPPKHIHVHGPGAVSESSSVNSNSRNSSVAPQHYSIQQQSQPNEYEEEETREVRPGLPPRSSSGAESMPGSRDPAPAPPPRLPPRQNFQTSGANTSSLPSAMHNVQTQSSYLNRGADTRLGQAGVSVSGFGIGKTKIEANEQLAATQDSSNQLHELQSRFTRMQKPSSSDPANSAPSNGTSWAQKQSALQTAARFKQDPSSVSLADVRDTASTARNFQQRHGEQVASGLRSANDINQKYDVSGKIGGFMQGATGASQTLTETQKASSHQADAATIAAKKPPPPPPPKKKPGLVTNGTFASLEPPPIPLASKPR